MKSSEAMRGLLIKFFALWILSLSFFARAVDVAVIRSEETVSASERDYAASVARHIARWYDLAGVECVLGRDTQLGEALAEAKLAVLVCMERPTARHMAQLRGFVSRGGKLMVFYSSSPALAALMGVRPLRYMRCELADRWAQMHFSGSRPSGCPGSIRQSSPNLFLMEPVPGKSTVMAWWKTRDGKLTEEPAWLRSENGYWMTHVLSADGDTEGKTQMLVSMAAAFNPGLWERAAKVSLQRGEERRRFVAEQVAQADAKKKSGVEKRLIALSNRVESVSAFAADGDGYRAWLAARAADSIAVEIYGSLQDGRASEIRAVWAHVASGLNSGGWAQTMRTLKHAGVTDVFVNVAGGAYAHYASDVLPRSNFFDEYGDQLAACCNAAARTGIRVHAWICCFSLDNATAARFEIFKARRWTVVDEEGVHRRWLNPAVPAVREYLLRAVAEMARRYPVAGIHADFVRYPDDPRTIYSEDLRSAFEKSEDIKVREWPSGVKRGAPRQAFFGWRANQVTSFVRQARREIRRTGTGKIFSVAVFGKYPSCYESVGQDWESWIDTGFIDYAVPMNYTESAELFDGLLEEQSKTRSRTMAVLPGIGVTSASSRLDAVQVIDQIKQVRAKGFPGFALFDFDTALRQEILPVLCLGLTGNQVRKRALDCSE